MRDNLFLLAESNFFSRVSDKDTVGWLYDIAPGTKDSGRKKVRTGNRIKLLLNSGRSHLSWAETWMEQ